MNSSPFSLVTELDRLLTVLEARGSQIRQFLRPGLDPTSIRERLESAGVAPLETVVELYSWADGTDTDLGPGPRLFSRPWLTLDMALAERAMRLEVAKQTAAEIPELDAASLFAPSWLPVLGHDADVVVETSGPQAGAILEVYDDDEPSRVAPSLVAFVMDQIAQHMQGTLRVGSRGSVLTPGAAEPSSMEWLPVVNIRFRNGDLRIPFGALRAMQAHLVKHPLQARERFLIKGQSPGTVSGNRDMESEQCEMVARAVVDRGLTRDRVVLEQSDLPSSGFAHHILVLRKAHPGPDLD